MENLFDKIIENNNNNKVKSICKKLRKKLSFKSGKDVENLCHLIYWLYILNEIELGKQCIGLTHEIPFDQNYDVWDFIHSIWGLEIKILRKEGKNNEANDIAKIIEQHFLVDGAEIDNKKLMDISYNKEIEESIADDDNKGANNWRFIALFSLIGDTETGLYSDLNNKKEEIEETIKNYIEEILK